METYERHEYWVKPAPVLASAEKHPDSAPLAADTPTDSLPAPDYTAGSFYVAVNMRVEVRKAVAETWDAEHPLPEESPPPEETPVVVAT